MGRTPQIVRMFVLARELARSRRGVALKPFAERHGWPWRNVYRDRDALEHAGLPVVEVSPGRYGLSPGALETWIDGAPNDELLALFLARQWSASLGATAMGRSLKRLWNRLSRRGGRQPELLPTASSHLSIRAAAPVDYTPHQETIATLERAIEERRCVRCTYRSRLGDLTERVVEPGMLHVDVAVDGVYLIGWCRLRRAVRYFAVQRLQTLELLDEPCQPHDEIHPSRQRSAFRLWWRDQVERVRVRFSPRVAQEIRERTWHATQVLMEQDDGGVVLSIEVAAPEELERWLLGYAGEAEVLEPVALADRVRQQHEGAAEKLGHGPTTTTAAERPRRAGRGLRGTAGVDGTSKRLSRGDNGSVQASRKPSTRRGVRR